MHASAGPALTAALLASIAVAACDRKSEPVPCAGDVCCASSRDCLGWQTCDAGGSCVTSPLCVDDGDCLRDDVCAPDGWCSPSPRFDPEGMTVWGLLHSGSIGMGVASLDESTRVYGGVPDRDVVPYAAFTIRPRLRPDGSIIYLVLETDEAGQHVTLRKWTWDAWDTDGQVFDPPLHDLENDPILPTPACEPQGDLRVRAGSGELIHTCLLESYDWFDGEGNLVVADRSVNAWHANGTMLVSHPSEPDVKLFHLRDAAGNERPVLDSAEPPYRLWPEKLWHARAHAEGFWLLYEVQGTGHLERWFVGPDALPVREGAFPDLDANRTVFNQPRIDGLGRLHARDWVVDPETGGLRTAFVRCPPGPRSGCVVVFDGTVNLPEAPPWDERPVFQIVPWTEPLLTGP